MKKPEDQNQKSLTDYCVQQNPESYDRRHPRQLAITDSLIVDFIVGCSLQVSIVENSKFRHFLEVVDKKYVPPARATITSYLENKVESVRNDLKEELKETDSINMTVDIWLDCKMQGYMAATAHYVKRGDFQLKFKLLSIKRLTGSHTGERIAAAFDDILDTYSIRQKIDHI